MSDIDLYAVNIVCIISDDVCDVDYPKYQPTTEGVYTDLKVAIKNAKEKLRGMQKGPESDQCGSFIEVEPDSDWEYFALFVDSGWSVSVCKVTARLCSVEIDRY